MTGAEAGIPRPAPSAADLAARVDSKLDKALDRPLTLAERRFAKDASAALLARCEEADDLRARMALLHGALRRGAETGESDAIRAWCSLTLAALASPQETTT